MYKIDRRRSGLPGVAVLAHHKPLIKNLDETEFKSSNDDLLMSAIRFAPFAADTRLNGCSSCLCDLRGRVRDGCIREKREGECGKEYERERGGNNSRT